jgi:hypothetical protein
MSRVAEFRDYGRWQQAIPMFEGFLQARQVALGKLQEAAESGDLRECGTDVSDELLFEAARRSGDESLMESASSSDFATYLNDKATKRLMWGYNDVPTSWRSYTRTYSVSDFKPIFFTRLTEMQDLLEIPEGGEYKDSQIAEIVGPSLSVKTFGRLFSITRKALINDDLNQLRDRPAAMGRAAARTIGHSIVANLEANPNAYDGTALFAAGHNNLLSGAGFALSEDALAQAIVKLRLQTDPNGNKIGLRPRTLLIPAQLELVARRILNSVGVPQPNQTTLGAGGASPQHGTGGVNVMQGIVDYAVEEYLTDANDWYLFADPNEAPTVAAGFLNGKETPDIMLRDPGMRLILGGSDPYSMEFDEIVWKIRHDWGVGVFDWRGAVKVSVP